jgi:ribosomal protein S18 acetylase RimI-like enzyme
LTLGSGTGRAHRAYVEAWAQRTPGISFRPISPADRDFLCALYASTRDEELRLVPWPEEAKRQFLQQQFELQHQHYHTVYPDAAYLLILERAQPIGRVYLHRGARELDLIEISLIAARRGHGIGTALMREMLEEAGATSRSVALHVEPNNPARHLYARLGFELVEQRGVYDFMRWSPRP